MSRRSALRRQQHRCMFLRDHLRRVGDRSYDPDAALLRQFNPLFPRFTGLTVAQKSLQYALLLLYSDDRTYGTDDAGEANHILRKILDHQDLRPGSKTRGNFFWMTHWDRVKDENAVSFLCSGLVHAYLGFPHKLRDETTAALERAFPEILAGIRSHKVRWQYTNIFFLNVGGLVSLSRVLDDPSVHEEAVDDFRTWLEGTSADGFHEFNSPTYTPVTLFGMEAAWANTRDAEFRARLERTMDVVTYQLALNLFPNGFLGGSPSRAYRNDALHGTGWAALYAHVKFGTPCPPLSDVKLTTYADLTLFDYVPPEAVRALASEKAEYAEIHDRGISIGSRRTHVITPRYSLSSQCTEHVGGHSPPSYVLVVRDASGPRRSVPLLPDESFTHQPCAGFRSRQIGNRIVGRLHYELADEMREKFLSDPTCLCEPRMLFGLGDQIREVRVGNVDWGGGDVRLLPGQSVAVSYGDLFLGVVPLPLEGPGRASAEAARLAYGTDQELRLHLRLFGGPELGPENEPVDFLLFVEAVAADSGKDLAAYAEALSGWRLSREGTGTSPAFSATHTDGTVLAYPPTEADPDPIGDALHISPGLALRPGDLTGLVAGETAWPFLG